jgi:hypothetical protein
MSNQALDLEFILSLYEKYEKDLKKVRQQLKFVYVTKGYPFYRSLPGYKLLKNVFKKSPNYYLNPQLDDIEAEITYLLIRETKPQNIVEFSPCGGWSSMWILHALKDNGSGTLHSYDLIDDSIKIIPQKLSAGRRNFVRGDVKKTISEFPASIDYLFIDSDHSEEFTNWYIENVFPKLRPGTPVSIHDVFHTADAGEFDKEGAVIIEWLKKNDLNYFSAAKNKFPSNFNNITNLKSKFGLNWKVHFVETNSMIFFKSH